jgi:hypothetical protein
MVSKETMGVILDRVERIMSNGYGEIRIIVQDGLILRIETVESTMLREVKALKAQTAKK